MATYYLSPAAMLIQQLNNQGQLLAGGLLYVYQAGTTTAQTNYTDYTATTQNAQPIVLTSYGRLPYSIWLATNQPHKIVLQDSSGNTLYVVDNLTGINDPAVFTSGTGTAVTEVSGSFTGGLSGMSSTVNVTCNYYIHNNMVSMTIASGTGTSNASTMTLTSVPSAIQPVSSKMTPILMLEDNGSVNTVGSLYLGASSTWTFYLNASASGFTSSGTKGIPNAISISWDLS